MKKIIALSILSVLLLGGCGARPNQVEEDESGAEWFADEVLDVDDWGKKKKSKSGITTPSAKSSTSKPKNSTSKKK